MFMERLNLSDVAREIAKTNAEVAFDQRYSKAYGGSASRAVAAHAQNVFDTLQERGVVGEDSAAIALYYARVAECYANKAG